MGYIKNLDEIGRSPLHRDVVEVLEKGLEAADPEKVVPRAVGLERNTLIVRGERIEIGGRIWVAGFGKASISMLRGLLKALGNTVSGGAVIAPLEVQPDLGRVQGIEILRGEHPLPGRNTLESSRKLLEVLEGVEEGDTVLVLISGGGSALFEVPEEGVGIEDIAEISEKLMRSGADIEELNAVRKHLSRVKGGRLAKILRRRGARIVALIVSDVVGDRIETVASGPTSPDPTSYCEALRIVEKRLGGQAPPEILKILRRGCEGLLDDTPKPGDPDLGAVRNLVMISSRDSLEAMLLRSSEMGYRSMILSNMIEGEAREAGKLLAGIARSMARSSLPLRTPAMILASGETTVRVRGRGIGGRNQELALSAATRLGERGCLVASIGSDGVDGNSPAAGGVGDWDVVEDSERMGLDLHESLENNDSYTALRKLGRSVITGPTGINVGDLIVIASAPEKLARP